MIDDTRPPSFWDTVCQDADAYDWKIDRHAPLIFRILQTLRVMRHKPGFACVFWLRVNQLFVRKGWRGQFRIRMWRQYRFGNDISPYADIGPGLFLPHIFDITIGARARTGKNVTLYNGVTLGSNRNDAGMPQLGDNVIVYTGAKVIGSVHIGDNSVIGALTLCLTDVPPQSVMFGIPPNVNIKPNKILTR